jgi:3',5'-cyclic AMP phosphodiesterase CpdA
MPFTVVQLTDPHIGATWSPDPAGALLAAVDAVGATLTEAPDAVVVSGDLASTPSDGEYAQARKLLAAPHYVLPGNHDDREGLRAHFDFPSGAAGAGLSYAVDLGPLRLIALDSKHPHTAGGQLDSPRLTWLDQTLGQDGATPTLLAMHHPPIVTGIPAMDAIGIVQEERAALAEILARHPQVQLIAAGHVHRAIIGALGGTRVLAIPSTDVQLALDFEDGELRFVPEPPCFAAHVLVEGQIVSHLQPVAD